MCPQFQGQNFKNRIGYPVAPMNIFFLKPPLGIKRQINDTLTNVYVLNGLNELRLIIK